MWTRAGVVNHKSAVFAGFAQPYLVEKYFRPGGGLD
jgi:hypothetical protein